MINKDIAQILSNFKQPNFSNSFFLSFEGIEASGKTTQIKLVKDYLEKNGKRVILIREPGGTAFGENLRNAILNSEVPLHPMAEAHLFASSRAQLLHEVILKELKEPNTVIICDRYIDSSIAYQGIARGLGIQAVLDLHKSYPLCTLPHLTLYIKISIETSLSRQIVRNQEKDYFESEKTEFYKKLITGYDESSKIFPNRIQVINGESSTDKVFELVKQQLNSLINFN